MPENLIRHIDLKLARAKAQAHTFARIEACFSRALNGHFQSYRVVWRMYQVLPGAQITFGRLNRCVAKQQLNLFELAAGRSAQLRAGTPPMPHAA